MQDLYIIFIIITFVVPVVCILADNAHWERKSWQLAKGHRGRDRLSIFRAGGLAAGPANSPRFCPKLQLAAK